MLMERLRELGLEMPELSPPVASYLPARRHAGLIYVSGQLPMKDGALLATGPVPSGASAEQAKDAMAQSFLNGLAAALQVCEAAELTGVLKLGAYVASDPDFSQQHLIANGASQLAQDIFGEPGRHVRFAVGVSTLPLNASVELEIIFTTK